MAIRETARTPNYSGTSSAQWNAPGFVKCINGYYKHHPDASRPDDEINTVDEAPAAMKRWIASLSLLGNSKADTFDELLFFPVVDPSTMKLNKSALVAVVSGRGSQADISDAQLTSSRKKAYSLLVKEFDYDKEDVPSEYKSYTKQELIDEAKEDIEEL
ncbi:MAG: hypothetical protein K9L56_14605 [Clostridiales bacterium]|nr:hypothetical protein [Clostridiales bacterium]